MPKNSLQELKSMNNKTNLGHLITRLWGFSSNFVHKNCLFLYFKPCFSASRQLYKSLSNLQEPEESIRPKTARQELIFILLNTKFWHVTWLYVNISIQWIFIRSKWCKIKIFLQLYKFTAMLYSFIQHPFKFCWTYIQSSFHSIKISSLNETLYLNVTLVNCFWCIIWMLFFYWFKFRSIIEHKYIVI